MNLSKHVTLKEFIFSATAIRHGIYNGMTAEQTKRAIDLCENCFEPIRAKVDKPIKINSGFRSEKLNGVISKSSKTSQHCKGEAMDLNLQDRKIFDWIIDNVKFDQLIYEYGDDEAPDWIHISFRAEKNRKQVIRTNKTGGYMLYKRKY